MTTPAAIPPRPADFEAFRESMLQDAMAITAAAQQSLQDQEAAERAAEEGRADNIAGLQARIAVTMAPPPDTSIHIAWFEAALASLGYLDQVLAAIATDPVKAALYRRATSISETDADVLAVASALNINLASVFTAARALRAARGG